jgi:acetyltransferase-like isoleucine patch superfamily enzyme
MEGAHSDGHPASNGDVVVGPDVWVGHGVVIMSGVTVGAGTVLAAQAVVTKDIPPYSIVAGNPARVVRSRFSPEDVDFLLRVRWWDWDDARIRAIVPVLCSDDLRALREVCEGV